MRSGGPKAACSPPRLIATRMTTGTGTWPPNMYAQFAAWFTIGSTARSMKSIRGWNTIGRIPAMAAPIAAPVVAFSLTGESRTRSRPNSLSMSFRLVPAYHGLHSPWPRRKTRGSLRRSCACASRMACA